MNYVCGYLFLQFKDSHEFRQINPSQTLMNIQLCDENFRSDVFCYFQIYAVLCILDLMI